MAALADASARFRLPRESLRDLIAGVRMDVTGTSYADFAELEVYCRRVAGSIGRLCLAIFGTAPRHLRPRGLRLGGRTRRGRRPRGRPRERRPRAPPAGAAVRRASWRTTWGSRLQLANIARDLREDAERGRVYLPARDLVRYHLHDEARSTRRRCRRSRARRAIAEPSVVAGFEGGDVGQLYALMRFQCLRSRDWFHRGMELVALLDRRSAACVLAMAGIYWRLLHHIEERPDRALARRARLKKSEKAWVAARALAGKGIPERHPAERLQPEDS